MSARRPRTCGFSQRHPPICSTVPAAVPSDAHSCDPSSGSSTTKNTFDPTAISGDSICDGCNAPAGVTRFTSVGPAAAPLVRHNSSVVNVDGFYAT